MVYTLRFFPLQNAVCFIILTCLVSELFTFYIEDVLKLKKNQEVKVKVKVKQSLDRPRGFQEGETHRFQDIPHMKVVRLSALGTGRPYPPRNTPGTHFC